MMSPDEVRACYRLYAAYYTSRGISPYRRVLASLVQLRHSVFKESFAQIGWAELKTQKQSPPALRRPAAHRLAASSAKE